MEFCGGLASPFPNTATVESDFSVLKWEKDLHRSNITSFSLVRDLTLLSDSLFAEKLAMKANDRRDF
jgi:hypothetical protein